MDLSNSVAYYGGSRIRDFQQVEMSNTFAADLLDEVKQHCRIQQNNEDLILARYINMALRSVENVLHKDIFPRTVSCRWLGGGKIYISAGEIRNLTLHTGTSPDEVDQLDLVREWGDRGFRGGGLFLQYNNAAYAPVLDESDGDLFLAFDTGFELTTSIPDEIVVFVCEMVAFVYVNRELGGVGTVAFEVEAIPKYLLEPLMRMVIA